MRHSTLIGALAALAAVGCSPSTETSVVRLVDRAERSVIVSSPLLEAGSSGADPVALERLETLRGAWPSDDDVDGLGLVRRGRLLPLPRVGYTRPPYDSTYEVRDALFAPTPSHLKFTLDVPRGGRLTFSYSLAEGSVRGDVTTFEVRVARGEETATVFVDTVDAYRLYWHHASVDLSPWAGARVDLHLITSAPDSGGLAFWGNPIVDRPRAPGEPPNVLLIGIDTLRADRLSSYGYRRNTSPNIDTLAGEGIRFDNAISAANWTAPSFASIFTGLPASRHGVRTDPKRWTPARYDEATSVLRPLAAEVVTLAELLRDGGWRTEAIALKPALFDVGLDQGFDRWFNMPTSYPTGQTSLDRAIGWLEENHDRRFFMFLHLNDPHQPFNQPPEYESPFGGREVREALGFELPLTIARGAVKGCAACAPDGRVGPDFITVARDLYDGEIAFTDPLGGALVAALKEWGVYDDTVIALLADHGEILYDRGQFYGHGGRWMTDELLRVPMILKPHDTAGLPRGLVVGDQVRTTDLLPTLLDLAGLVPGAATADSRTLLDTIRDPGAGSRPAFSESPQKNAVSLRTGRWKYVVRAKRRQAVYELYDLDTDPGERRNIVASHADEAARLAESVVPYLLRSRAGPFLLALGDGSPGEFQLLLESSRPGTKTTHILGVAPTSGKAPATAPGKVRGRVIALVQLELEPGAAISARLLSEGRPLASRTATPDRMISYRDGIFASLLELETPNLYFLHGAPDLSSAAPLAPANVDQIEELRALGYID